MGVEVRSKARLVVSSLSRPGCEKEDSVVRLRLVTLTALLRRRLLFLLPLKVVQEGEGLGMRGAGRGLASELELGKQVS